jgi:hypothetical protein
MVDIERLDAVLEYISEHPEQHSQNLWASKTHCGTVACLAGWTVILEYPGAELEGGSLARVDGVTMIIRDEARDLLGLNTAQEDALFLGAQNIVELRKLRDYIVAHPEASVPELYGVLP